MLDNKMLSCLKLNCQNITFCESPNGERKKENCPLFSEMKTSLGVKKEKPAIKKVSAKDYYLKKDTEQ